MGAAKGNQYARRKITGRHINVWITRKEVALLQHLLQEMGVSVSNQELDALARSAIRDALDDMVARVHSLHSPTDGA